MEFFILRKENLNDSVYMIVLKVFALFQIAIEHCCVFCAISTIGEKVLSQYVYVYCCVVCKVDQPKLDQPDNQRCPCNVA